MTVLTLNMKKAPAIPIRPLDLSFALGPQYSRPILQFEFEII